MTWFRLKSKSSCTELFAKSVSYFYHMDSVYKRKYHSHAESGLLCSVPGYWNGSAGPLRHCNSLLSKVNDLGMRCMDDKYRLCIHGCSIWTTNCVAAKVGTEFSSERSASQGRTRCISCTLLYIFIRPLMLVIMYSVDIMNTVLFTTCLNILFFL